MHKKILSFQNRFRKTHAAKFRALKRFHDHPVIIPAVTFVLLIGLTTGGFLLFNHGSPKFKPIVDYIVIISHDNIEQTVPTRERTIGDLLSKLKIKINTGDVVEPVINTAITQDNLRVNIYRAVPVEIIDHGHKTFAFSAAKTPIAIAQQAGIKVYPEDSVIDESASNFALQQTISKQVVIIPATPVNLNIFGIQTVIRTHSATVGELLTEKGIKLGRGDSVKPAVSTPIAANMQIFLLHRGAKIVSVSQTIPTPVEVIKDNSLTFGTSAIRQQGSSGQEILTYQIITINGQVTQKRLIQTVITVPPITEIVAEGQTVQIPSDKQTVMAEAGIPSYDFAYVNYIVSNESGWCPTKLQGEVGYCPGYAPTYVPSYLGYGLGQATPGYKMSPFGSDWETNPVTQLRWATAYANGTYGGWAGAYDHWQAYHYW